MLLWLWLQDTVKSSGSLITFGFGATNIAAIAALIYQVGQQMQRLDSISETIKKLDKLEDAVITHSINIQTLQETAGALLRTREAEIKFTKTDQEVKRINARVDILNAAVVEIRDATVALPDRLYILEQKLDNILRRYGAHPS